MRKNIATSRRLTNQATPHHFQDVIQHKCCKKSIISRSHNSAQCQNDIFTSRKQEMTTWRRQLTIELLIEAWIRLNLRNELKCAFKLCYFRQQFPLPFAKEKGYTSLSNTFVIEFPILNDSLKFKLKKRNLK